MVALVGILVGLLCFWGMEYYHKEIKRDTFNISQLLEWGYVPLGQILNIENYEDSKEDLGEYKFTNDQRGIEIIVDRALSELKKNEYTFEVDNRMMLLNDEIYVKQEFLEAVLNVEISQEPGGEFVTQEKVQNPHAWISDIPLIAHAGGGILVQASDNKYEQYSYTNSKEAFISSYDKGYRVMEMDLELSSDGVLCCLHNWDDYGGIMEAAEWKNQKIEGKYTTLVFEDILREMEINKDIFLVLDIKNLTLTDEDLVTQYQTIYEMAMQYGGDQLAQRIIPQIYRQNEYELVKQVYAWNSIIYTLYRQEEVSDEEIVHFVEDKDDILVVTMPQNRVNEEFCVMLHTIGKLTYTHTINETDTLYLFLNQGIDGFYTDTVMPEAYISRYAQN